jgi:DNA helicase-2/ATP-dependent DNA helicase PcrA
MHDVVYFYLKHRLAGKSIAREMLLKEYDRRWDNQGYLSREHEEKRKRAGRKALLCFYRREESSGQTPGLLEKGFRWFEGGLKFIGRWDRVDYGPDGAVITDYKASQVKDQKEADKKARDSLQLSLYAYSFFKMEERFPAELRLHFLESDRIGHSRTGETEIQKALARLREVENGIRGRHFEARPDWHNCSYCEFKTICPSTYAF